MVLGCAKGEEIDLQQVVILPSRPPSAADASVDSGGAPPATTSEVSSPVVLDASPDTEALEAPPAALSDAGP